MKNGLIVETMMDLTNGAKTCIFNPDGVFGIHNYVISCPVPHPYLSVLLFAVAAISSWRGELRVWTQWSQ
jgi:hypothetical protein